MAGKLDYLKLFRTIGRSKKLLRSGWIREKVKDPESVAEHSFRVAMMAMVLSDKLDLEINAEKLVDMALLHDIGEVITGDLVYQRGAYIDIGVRGEKEKEEREGIKKIFSDIGEGEKYAVIFDEMINRTSMEAKIFWQLDKLEMAVQALEYEKEQGLRLNEFFDSTSLLLKEPLLRDIFDDIMKARKRRKP